ncbi:MAG: tryptophan synthase subunit alpha [Syntrophales bacterium]|nr:tryptophan synthase subunit alpha [Syntrophales bacterium]
MGRIDTRFATLKGKGEKALIAYITAGHPDLEITEAVIPALADAGVDVVEIGVPFSDPTADGPIIQGSSQKALRSGTTLPSILEMIKRFRNRVAIPLVLFSYYNPIFVFGAERFARVAAESGIDGILVVDLPPEEACELRCYTDKAGLDFIPLVAPTTSSKRMRLIVKEGSGFIYYITLTGVTGTGRPFVEEVKERVLEIKSFSPLPVVVGFGISTPEQAAEIASFADGVVVGSAFVKLMDSVSREDLVEKVCKFASSIKLAMDNSR